MSSCCRHVPQARLDAKFREFAQAAKLPPLRFGEVPEPQPLTILVVEDHADTRRMMGVYLELLGHRCELAEDAGTAISRAAAGPFDVLLTDVHMPGHDSFELVQILRDNERLPALVVSMSAGVLEHEMERSVAAGCRVHLLKPFPVQELEAALALHNA